MLRPILAFFMSLSLILAPLRTAYAEPFVMTEATWVATPLTSCLLGGALGARDQGTSKAVGLGCALGLAAGMADESGRYFEVFKGYLFSSALIGAGLLGSTHKTYGRYAGAGVGALIGSGFVDGSFAYGLMINAMSLMAMSKIASLAKGSLVQALPESFTSHLNMPLQLAYDGFVVWAAMTLSPEHSGQLPVVGKFHEFFSAAFSQSSDQRELDEDLPRYLVNTLSASAFMINFNTLIWKSFYHFMSVIRENRPGEQSWQSNPLLVPFGICLAQSLGFLMSEYLVSQIQSSLHEDLVYKARHVIEASYFKGENPLKISKMNNTQAVMMRTEEDVQVALEEGYRLFSGELKTKSKRLSAVSSLYGLGSLDFYVVIYIYNQMVEQFVSYLSETSAHLQKELNDLASTQYYLRKDSFDKSETVLLNQQMDSLKERKEALNRKQREISINKRRVDLALESITNVKGFIDFLVSQIFSGQKIANAVFSANEHGIFTAAGVDLSEAMDWVYSNAQTVGELRLSLDNLVTTVKNIEAEDEDFCHNLHRQTQQGPQPRVIFSGMKVFDKEQTQNLFIPHLDLGPGFYAVTGKSGTGKSTLMKKIFGLERNKVCSDGSLTFFTEDGLPSPVYMVTQDFYAAPETSLFEVMTGRIRSGMSDAEYAQQKAWMIELLKEVEIDELAKSEQGLIAELDTVKDWQASGALSGGQKKKINLVSLILATKIKSPKFIIIDEIFAGLDPFSSLPKVKGMLQKYLNHAVVFMVDHGNADFFKQALVFEDGTVRLIDLN